MCGSEPCAECDEKGCENIKMILARADIPTTVQGQGYDYKGFDVQVIQEYKDEIMKQMASQGWRAAPTTLIPAPDPGDVPQRVPSFVKPEDKMLVWLATMMYRPLAMEIPGATLSSKYTSSRIGVWISPQVVYVAFRGTDVGAPDRSKDIIDDLAIASGAGCDVSIVASGVITLTQIYNDGYTNINLCGHSLGGRAALCCASLPGVSKTVVINAAAPFVSVQSIGPGEEKATHYHIFGDLISSHLIGAKHISVRVGLGQFSQRNEWYLGRDVVYNVNWLDPYFHSTDRFLNEDYWQFSTPQEEQDSLETFFFETVRGGLEILSLLTSTVGAPFAAFLKTKICQNPIPGSKKYRFCNTETSTMQQILNGIMKGLGAIIGGIIGFLTTGTVDGIVKGRDVGIAAASGDLGPLIATVFPDFNKLSFQLQEIIKDIITIVRNEQTNGEIDLEKIKEKTIFAIVPNIRLPRKFDEPPTELTKTGTTSTTKQSTSNFFTPFELYKMIEPKMNEYLKTLKIPEIKKTITTKIKNEIQAKIKFEIDTYLDPDAETLPTVTKKMKKKFVDTGRVVFVSKVKKNVSKKTK